MKPAPVHWLWRPLTAGAWEEWLLLLLDCPTWRVSVSCSLHGECCYVLVASGVDIPCLPLVWFKVFVSLQAEVGASFICVTPTLIPDNLHKVQKMKRFCEQQDRLNSWEPLFGRWNVRMFCRPNGSWEQPFGPWNICLFGRSKKNESNCFGPWRWSRSGEHPFGFWNVLIGKSSGFKHNFLVLEKYGRFVDRIVLESNITDLVICEVFEDQKVFESNFLLLEI